MRIFRGGKWVLAGLLAAAPALALADEGTGAALAGEPSAHMINDSLVARHVDKVTLTSEVDTVRAHIDGDAAQALGAQGRSLSELAGLNYRLWMGRGRTELGVGVGTLGYVRVSPDAQAEALSTLVNTSPTLAVGLRHRFSGGSVIYADALGTRTLGGERNAGYVNTKVGMEWKPAKPRFGFEHGTVGIHFDSGFRLDVKARRGGLSLYLRGQF